MAKRPTVQWLMSAKPVINSERAAEGRAEDMLDSIRALEFYCGIGMSGRLIRVSYCERMEQVDCTALSQRAVSETTRALFALLIGTNLLVLYTWQTTVLALHRGYVFRW